ncbi:DUF429 domain-containing protein [Halorubrum halodurans]|uniref:DUF429 domain-containing protein n=1 Tax=Halorubrum halodurans TaxID=1383851 RepID=A0A256IN00_9EURY|nr:DUF429 domain-containing protein [Halorubrum halodurans]OYR57950.1 hypothetical protein DJ70_04560 [Halorubrum halodurans]
MASYVGVDWASRGWLTVAIDDGEWTARMSPSIHSVWFDHHDAESILVDVPIGLPESERRGCDRGAKEFLGSDRARSVFWTPCRDAVEADTYDDARRANRDARDDSLSSQVWGLIPRIREVDRLLRDVTEARKTMLESHPEVCFEAFAEEGLPSKHEDDGLSRRRELLEGTDASADGVYDGFVERYIDGQPPWARRIGNANRDDLLDAMVLALAAKVADGDFERVLDHAEDGVESIPRDEAGLPMQIVYADPE